jgi:Tol biopolymer transport system component/SH3-like domain-containing protein
MKKRFASILILVMLLILPALALAQDNSPGSNVKDIDHFVAVVSVDRANLRTGPSLGHSVVGQVTLGTQLPIQTISEDGNWYYVEKRNSQRVWISSSVVTLKQFDPASALAPANTALYISLDTSPGMFDRMEDMFTIFSNTSTPVMSDELNRLLFLLFLNDEITVDQVRPWLGDEVAVVNLRCLSSTMSNFVMEGVDQDTPAPEVVVMASTLDRGTAQLFLDGLYNDGSLGDVPSQEITYKGYSYRLLSDEPNASDASELPVVAMGVVDDYVVFAQGAKAYETVIDVATGGTPSLMQGSGFQGVYSQLSPEAFTRVYAGPALFCPVHDPILYESLVSQTFKSNAVNVEELSFDDTETLQDQVVALLDNAFQGYAMGFRRDGDELDLDLVSGVDMAELQSVTGLSATELAALSDESGIELFGFLTQSTLEVLTFGNITNTYDSLSSLSATSQEEMFEEGTGMDRDVLAWIDGSITMGFVGYPVFNSSVESTDPSHFVMIIEAGSEEQATAALEAFSEASEGVPVQQSELKDIPVTSFVTTGETDASRTMELATVDNYVILVTGGNMSRVLDDVIQSDGTVDPDWRRIGRLPLDGVASDDAPFAVNIDFGSFGVNSQVQAAAIVSPPQQEGGTSQVTIICSICREGEKCGEEPDLLCGQVGFDDNGVPIIDPDIICDDTDIPREEWMPIEVGPAVCPDYILYQTDQTTPPDALAADWEIFRIGGEEEFGDDFNVSKGVGERVYDMFPSRSPDSQYVVFSSTRDSVPPSINWEIYVTSVGDIGPDGGRIVQRVTYNNRAVDIDPVWSPGGAFDAGSLIAFESNRDGDWNLYMLDVRTGVERQLTDDPANDLNAYWYPDGSKFLFQSDRDGMWQIYELDLTQTDEFGMPIVTRLSDGVGDDLEPRYSNDGERILFRSYRDGEMSVVYVMNVDGTELQQISDPVGDARNAIWSPDDNLVTYDSDLDGDRDVYVYEFDSEVTRLVTDNDVPDYAPSWICDTPTLLFTSDIDEREDGTPDPNIFSTPGLPIEDDPIIVDEEATRLTTDDSVDTFPLDSPSDEDASRKGDESLPGWRNR